MHVRCYEDYHPKPANPDESPPTDQQQTTDSQAGAIAHTAHQCNGHCPAGAAETGNQQRGRVIADVGLERRRSHSQPQTHTSADMDAGAVKDSRVNAAEQSAEHVPVVQPRQQAGQATLPPKARRATADELRRGSVDGHLVPSGLSKKQCKYAYY
jgi:hypothetical protein